MPRQAKEKQKIQRPKQTEAKPKQKGKRKVEERKITRDQFHKLVRKAAQPTKKPKSASK